MNAMGDYLIVNLNFTSPLKLKNEPYIIQALLKDTIKNCLKKYYTFKQK